MATKDKKKVLPSSHAHYRGNGFRVPLQPKKGDVGENRMMMSDAGNLQDLPIIEILRSVLLEAEWSQKGDAEPVSDVCFPLALGQFFTICYPCMIGGRLL